MKSEENNSHLLPEGTMLQGRYCVERQLSSGGFGNTYVVTNVRFNEHWAMKEFFMKSVSERDDDTSSVSVSKVSQQLFETQRTKFNKEAQRLRKLRHRGIVHVEDLFDENGTSYYVMDYVGGGSLSELVKQNGPLPQVRVLQLLPDILDALEYVHNQHMWHLDLKPGNILLDSDGHPVLIDFGASKQVGLAGANSTSLGMTYTPGYAPSEQVDQNFDRIGPWTDLYALGGTIYNLLTGNTPPSVSEIQELEDEAFEFPNQVSERMKSLVLWMMTPNRRKRPQSVQEVRDFLGIKPVEESSKPAGATPVAQEQPTIAHVEPREDHTRMPENKRPAQPQPKEQKPKKTNSILIWAMAIIVPLLVALVLGWAWQQKQPATAEAVVVDKEYPHPFGTYKYRGAVDRDGLPDGSGEAIFADGRSYKGIFKHGIMDGPALFRYPNGDVFEGAFRDNYFYRGRYTMAKDGSYYVGPFEKGQPTKEGNWFSSDGKKL